MSAPPFRIVAQARIDRTTIGGAQASHSSPGPSGDPATWPKPTTEAAAAPARRSIEGRSHAAVAAATASATQGTGSMFGNQWRVPRISAGRPSTVTGTTHSKISDGPAPATAGGGSGDIQWIRWSCHPYEPPCPTLAQSGGASADAAGGIAIPPSRHSFNQCVGEFRYSSTVPSGWICRYGSPSYPATSTVTPGSAPRRRKASPPATS